MKLESLRNETMATEPLRAEETADARELIRAALHQGVNASPLCRAVMGWLGETATEPFVAEIRRSADGWISLRLSDEETAGTLGTYRDFVDQVRIICESLQMSEAQTMQMFGWVRLRLF